MWSAGNDSGGTHMTKGTWVFITLLLVAVMQCGIAQTATNGSVSGQAPNSGTSAQIYQLPFASSGNTIELSVANTATIALVGVKVEATNLPSWLKFAATEQHIAVLKANQEMAATFTFAVDKTAPVQKNQTLKFVISAPSGEQWTKEITVAVAPPMKFEAYQNYPNPFNPTTAISYQLTANSSVSLKIYNMLGQQVASVVEGDRLAGYHLESWDATRYSSGMYIYRLIATDERGSKQIAHKRMLLLK
jgi:hypothetical protein